MFLEDFPEKGKHLAYHTRTQAQVVIDDELKSLLEGQRDIPESTAEQLRSMGYIVADAAEEDRNLDEWFHRLRTAQKRIVATVLTTYDCNFDCAYCVEEGVKGNGRMTRDTAERAVDYICRKAERLSPESVSIQFYGGEPLMNLEALRAVAEGVGTFAEGIGLPFGFGIITNGSLLTGRVVTDLKKKGLQAVKITLDGPAKQHDVKRPFRGGAGSFDVIMGNLRAALGEVDVEIGVNFDEENVGHIIELLDYLAGENLASRLARISFKPIVPTPEGRKAAGASADIGCVYSQAELPDNLVFLRKAAIEHGFVTEKGVGINTCAMVTTGSSFFIDPEGQLFRCAAFVGRKEFAVGHIDHPSRDDFSPIDLWQRCRECQFVPLCGDGCPASAYLRFGDMKKLNCQKDYMNKMVRENLKIDYHCRQ